MGTPFGIRKRIKKLAGKLLDRMLGDAPEPEVVTPRGPPEPTAHQPAPPPEAAARPQPAPEPVPSSPTETAPPAEPARKAKARAKQKDGADGQKQATEAKDEARNANMQAAEAKAEAPQASKEPEAESVEAPAGKARKKKASGPKLASVSGEERWQETRAGVLKFVSENGGSASLRELHDHSEREYLVAHQAFSRLMEELTDGDLLSYDHDSGVATLTEKGRSELL